MSGTTDVAAAIQTPDTVQSSVGTLELRDGAPSEEIEPHDAGSS
jgi:hypothetical protein